MAKNANKEQNGSRKARTALIVVCVVLVCAIVGVGLIGYYSSGFQDWANFQRGKSTIVTTGTSSEELNVQTTETKNVKLSVASTASGNSISKTLTATVLPIETKDKAVDWLIEWGEAPAHGTEAVTDYVTINPESDWSNVATATCIKAFDGDEIIITVRTRVNGYAARCTVTYAGVPTMLNPNLERVLRYNNANGKYEPLALNSVYDAQWGVFVYELPIMSNTDGFYFSPFYDNELHSVSDDYLLPIFNVSTKGYGSMSVKCTTYRKEGFTQWVQTAESTQTYDLNTIFSEDWNHSIIDETLPFEKKSLDWPPLKNVAVCPTSTRNFSDLSCEYQYTASNDTYKNVYTFESFPDPQKIPYVEVTYTDPKTGLSCVFNVRPSTEPKNVVIDTPSIAF